jgi:phospholipid transport system transporter-binding protein
VASTERAVPASAVLQEDNAVLALTGELSFETTPDLLDSQRDLFNRRDQLIIDCKEVTRSDSAGLALLIEWLRQSRRYHCQLTFRNLPGQMLDIARVSGVENLLPH